jgi:hypothetical protein
MFGLPINTSLAQQFGKQIGKNSRTGQPIYQITNREGYTQALKADLQAKDAGFASAEAQAVNRMARNQFEAKATAAGIPLSEAYGTIKTDLTSTTGIVDAINRLPGAKTTTPTTETDNGGGGGGGGTTTGTGQTEKQQPDYGKQFSDAITSLSSAFSTQLGQLSTKFADMQAAQEEQMQALRQSMLESQVRSYDRDTVAGVKTATGSGGDAMQIARRGVRGAFGRSGLRISSLNV